MSKALDTGKSFMDGILAKLPESLRESARTIFTAAEAQDALTTVGDGVLARNEFSRLADEVRTEKENLEAFRGELTSWYDERKGYLSDYDRLKAENARLTGKPAPTPTPDPAPKPAPTADVLDRKTVEQMLEGRDEALAGVLAISTTLAGQHFRDFGEVLDIDACIADARKGHISLKDAYDKRFADKIAAKRQKDEEADFDKRYNERRAKEKEAEGPNPFPLRNASPSVLDVLETKDGSAKHTIDSAVALYEDLQRARG